MLSSFFRRRAFLILREYRRRLLGRNRGSGLVADAEMLPPCSSRHIIVAGAGPAGLCAAYHLEQSGHKVTILEANNRPGGRIYTIRDRFQRGMFVEAGAGRIRDDHEWTMKYIRLFALTTELFYPANGRLVTDTDGNVSFADCPSLSSSQIHSLMTREQDWLCRGDLSDQANPFTANFRAPIWYRLSNGMDRLVRAFADRLQDHIRYGCPLVAVKQTDREVIAYTGNGSHTESLKADYLVCTLPLPCLQEIDFSPSMSEAKKRIIQQLPYTPATRFFLRVRRRVWENQRYNGFGVSDKLGEIWNLTQRYSMPEGIIVSYLQGDPAVRFGGLSGDERTRQMETHMNRLFPGIAEQIVDGFSHSWQEERWARGAQARPWELSQSPVPELMKPEGRVFLAGEHIASEFSLGWIDGAFESANRVVVQVHHAIQ